jgi:3-methyladenine DNA glycosylase Mpg
MGPTSGLWVLDDGTRVSVQRTSRVGVSGGRELPLRYILAGSPYLSRPSGWGASPCRLHEGGDA